MLLADEVPSKDLWDWRTHTVPVRGSVHFQDRIIPLVKRRSTPA